MMTFLPPIYEDELVFSWLSRCYSQSGYLTCSEFISDVFYSKSSNPSIEFIGHLSPQMDALIRQNFSIEQLVMEHTMFPQYARFLPIKAKETALRTLCYDFCDVHHLFSVLPRNVNDRYLKYCPICTEEDRIKHGETFWHRTHQIRNMRVCSKHGCYLESSNILAMSEKMFILCPAEESVTITTPRYVTNSNLLDYARYVAEVFHSPMDIRDVPISTVFYYALMGSKYMPRSPKARNMQLLYSDLKKYYERMELNDIATLSQLQRLMLGGNRFDFSVVCQLAFFLGISVEDLTHPNLSAEQIEKEQASHYIKNRIPIQWDLLDEEVAPRLEQLAHDTYYGKNGSRPNRVSERLVIREFCFNSHTLENLPKCRAILEKYTESYEESWARRLIWAYEKLESERNGKPFYSTDLRKLSGVKMKNISKVIPYISKHTDASTTEKILSLVRKSDYT